MTELYKYINSSGVIVPDTEQLQSDVEQEYKNVFGEDLDVTPETPQGRLIEIDTRLRSEVLQTIAEIANTINPNLSYGIFLDALSALTGCYRKPATRSSVECVLTGTPGTVIPINSLATNEDYSKVFYLGEGVILGEDGTATATFYAQDYGEVKLETGELNKIKSGVIGWETIINNTPATVGSELESDAELKERRINTLFKGRSLMGDIQSALYDVPGVKSVFVDQNYKKEPKTIRGITFKPGSVYACVYGGSDADIAMALYKTVICDYTGNTTVNVTDPWTQQQYSVSFQRPTEVQIDVKVYLKVSTGSGDVTGAVKQSILDYEDGLIPNVDSLKIGQEVSPFEIASAINMSVPGVFVQQVQIAKHGLTLSVNSIDIGIGEIARISEDNITIRYIS